MDKNERRDEGRGEDVKDDVELTQEEKMAFQRLPREAEPSRILEERIVTALREEGILGRRTEGAVTTGADRPGVHWFRPWMAMASVAASLVLFASGVFLGHWMGAGSTAQAFMAVRDQDAAQLALRIQEAGSDYVAALAALGQLGNASSQEGPGGGDLQEASTGVAQGSEVALGALYGAVYELARMNPNDADLAKFLQILEERRAREEGETGAVRNVIWF
jgi:hypothetical protein